MLSRPPYNFWFQLCNVVQQQRMKGYIKDSEHMSFGATRPSDNCKEAYVLPIGE